jgi:integrase
MPFLRSSRTSAHRAMCCSSQKDSAHLQETEKTRAIKLPTFAVAELHRLRRDQAERLLKLGIRHSGDCLVCGREDGGPMLPTSLTHEFAKVSGRVKDAPRVRFHGLRHSHATQLLLAGVHPKVTQERLDHASITTTLDLYSHVTATMQRMPRRSWTPFFDLL